MGKYIFSTLIIRTFCKWEKINHVVCVVKQGMCHTMALPVTLYKKKYLKAKKELSKFKYFTMQKYNLKKIIL
jgi:hypothetical protein